VRRCPKAVSVRSEHGGSGGRHLVVCCASGDRAALEPALDVLAARGLQVTVFEGAQPHTPALLEHVRRHGADAIYVLAKSTSLHAPRLERLTTALERAHVSPEHIVELDIDWRDPMALVEKVAAVPAPTKTLPPAPAKTLVPAPAKTLAPAPAKTLPSAQTLPPTPPLPPAQTLPPAPPPAQTLPPSFTPAPSGLRTVTASLRPIVRATGGWITRSRARMVGAGAGAIALVAATIVVLSLGGADDAEAASLTIVAMPASATERASEDAPAQEGDEAEVAIEPDAGDPEAPAADAQSPARAKKKSAAPARTGEHAGIVYAPLHPPKRNFQAAVAQCEAFNAKGATGWRLPTLGEMHTLAAAHVVDRGVYWSSTEADAFGKQALVWSEKKSRAAPIGKKWSGARAVCVRDTEPGA
jgi:hypothetical protein